MARGSGFFTAALDTACGPVQVGAMICYDREFPESARLLMLQGAELILVPNACPMGVNRLAQLRARAFENMLAVATCNYPAGVPDCNGCSTVFDGRGLCAARPLMAPGERTPRRAGICAFCARAAKRAFTFARLKPCAPARLPRKRGARQRYRRPQLYAPLAETAVRPPFVRPGRRP